MSAAFLSSLQGLLSDGSRVLLTGAALLLATYGLFILATLAFGLLLAGARVLTSRYMGRDARGGSHRWPAGTPS